MITKRVSNPGERCRFKPNKVIIVYYESLALKVIKSLDYALQCVFKIHFKTVVVTAFLGCVIIYFPSNTLQPTLLRDGDTSQDILILPLQNHSYAL